MADDSSAHPLVMTVAEYEAWAAERAAGAAGTLDLIEYNSTAVGLAGRLCSARTKAGRNVDWASARLLVDRESGEVLSGEDGEPLTLADVGKSWYTSSGCRQQAASMVKRLQRSGRWDSHYRPVFITLTVAPGRLGAGDKAAAWANVGQQLNRFFTRLRRWCQKRGCDSIPYFWTLEAHPDSSKPHYEWPHYHLVILGMPFCPVQQITAFWEVGRVDLKLLDSPGNVFRYMGKYMWKACELLTKGGGNLDALPDWWFYYRVFRRRRCGFSQFFQWDVVERLPRWVRERIEDLCALGGEVATVKRQVGGGWLVGLRLAGQVCEMAIGGRYVVCQR